VDKIEEAAERNAERQDSRPYNGRENFDDAAPRRVFVALQPPAAPAPEGAPAIEPPRRPAKLNSLGFLVRAASRAEVAAVKEQMSDLQDDLLADLEDVLKDSLPSTSKNRGRAGRKSPSMQNISLKSSPPLKSHNADQLQVLWVTLMKDSVRADELQKQVVLGRRICISEGQRRRPSLPRDIKHFRRSLEKSGVTGNVRRDTEKKRQAIGDNHHAPRKKRASGSTDATLKKAAIPSGAVEVLCNPQADERCHCGAR